MASTNWEYKTKVIDSFDKLHKALAEEGVKSWELVCVLHEARYVLFFKRPTP